MRGKRFKGEKRGKLLALLITTAIVITCFVYPQFYSVLLKREFNPNNLIRVSSFEERGKDQDRFAVFSGKLISLQGATLKLQAGDGNTLWERQTVLQKPFIGTLEDVIIAADMDEGIIYGISGDGEDLWQATPAGGIIRIGTNGEHVWTMGRQQGKTVIEVFDERGMETAYLNVNGVEITGVSVSQEDSPVIAVSAAGVESGNITGNIIMYKNDGTIIWAKSYTDSLVMSLGFAMGDALTVLGEKALMSLSAEGTIRWQNDIEGYITRALLTDKGVVAVNLGDDYRTGVYGNRNEETVLYNKEGVQLGRFPQDEQIIGLAEGQDCIGIYSKRRLKTVSLDGKRVQDKKFDSDLAVVYILENNFIAYISAGKLYFEPLI